MLASGFVQSEPVPALPLLTRGLTCGCSEATPMTLRHVVALALVGWYLMLAPGTSDCFALDSSQSSAGQEFVATEDTAVKTPHGDPFKVPKDWRLRSRAEFVLLNSPEGDALLGYRSCRCGRRRDRTKSGTDLAGFVEKLRISNSARIGCSCNLRCGVSSF